MGYKFEARIGLGTRTPDEINLASFGVRKGQEAEEFNPKKVASMLLSIGQTYAGMMAADKKSRKPQPTLKPLTFSWAKLSDKEVLFSKARGQALNITVTVTDQDNPNNVWEMIFDQVVLSAPTSEERIFPPDNYKRTDERFTGVFKSFREKE